MEVRFCVGQGALPDETGTCVKVRCPWDTFVTVRPDNKRCKRDFPTIVGFVMEELRYVYAGLLQAEKFDLRVVSVDSEGNETCRELTPLVPEWKDGYTVMPDVVRDLGGGLLTIHCTYGDIHASKENAIHFKANLKTSGVVISTNGRVLERVPFSAIYDRAQHPSMNSFLVVVDLESCENGLGALPTTKNTKTAFRESDPKLKALYSWIATYVKLPATDHDTLEARLVLALADAKRKDSGYVFAEPQVPVFEERGMKTKMDLVVGYQDHTELYEAKCYRSSPKDLWQLRMYYDGAISAGRLIDSAILVASRHSPDVVSLVSYLNDLCDPMGNPYHFSLSTWAAEGISVEEIKLAG